MASVRRETRLRGPYYVRVTTCTDTGLTVSIHRSKDGKTRWESIYDVNDGVESAAQTSLQRRITG